MAEIITALDKFIGPILWGLVFGAILFQSIYERKYETEELEKRSPYDRMKEWISSKKFVDSDFNRFIVSFLRAGLTLLWPILYPCLFLFFTIGAYIQPMVFLTMWNLILFLFLSKITFVSNALSFLGFYPQIEDTFISGVAIFTFCEAIGFFLMIPVVAVCDTVKLIRMRAAKELYKKSKSSAD